MKRLMGTFFLIAIAAFSAVAAPKSDRNAGTEPRQGSPAAFSAKIVYLEGEVWIDGRAAEIGMELPPRVTVRTGEKSKCDIVFNEKNAISISWKAEAVIDFGKAVAEVEMKRGGFAAVLRKLGKSVGSESFKVRTKAATAGVRGTSFCVWTDEDTSYICACNGSVRTIDRNGGNEFDLRAAHHTAKLYTISEQYVKAETAGLLHHSDAGVEDLASRIGERIDWTVMDEK